MTQDTLHHTIPVHVRSALCDVARLFFQATSCSLGKSLQMSIFVNLSLIAQQPIKIVPCLTVSIVENET